MDYDIATLSKMGWHNEDRLIACRPWVPGRGFKVQCELCHRFVSAYPATIKRAKEPEWHIICEPCHTGLKDFGHEMIPGGVVRDNKIIDYD